ncbi:site-2 protease family protein [Jatrophihabitans sp. DSM 45814]
MSSPRPSQGQPGADSARLVRLGSILGVPIFVTPSWLLVVGFVTISYSDFLRSRVAGLSTAGSYVLSLGFAVALALSVLAHELGHTVASRAVGLNVARIVVFLLGGVSEIEGEAQRPRDEFAIAAAGPLVSFLLAAGCWVGGLGASSNSSVGVMLELLAWSNLVIAVFNVLPGLPLDGGRLVQALFWMFGGNRSRGTTIAAWSGRVMAVVLAAAILILNVIVNDGRTLSFTSLIATALGFAVAAFLWFGATQTLRAESLNQRAAGIRLTALIRPTLYLDASTPISEAVRRVAESGSSGIVVVDSIGRSRALVRESQISQLDPVRRPWATLADVSRPLEAGLILQENLTGQQLLGVLRDNPASEYLVVGSDGTSRGVLATNDLVRALRQPRGGPTR